MLSEPRVTLLLGRRMLRILREMPAKPVAGRAYINSLACIAMELIHKYEKNDGVVGVDVLASWPVDSDAYNFFSAISPTRSLESLKNVN